MEILSRNVEKFLCFKTTVLYKYIYIIWTFYWVFLNFFEKSYKYIKIKFIV